MNDAVLNVYHRLPAILRSAAASARGYQLKSWRYGPETDRLVAEAIEREYWPESRWQEWRNERLERLLHTAAANVPYYMDQIESGKIAHEGVSALNLANWPILEKETLRRRSRDFVARDCDPRRMYCEHTSGTTGTSLRVWWSRQTVREWFALFEARCRHWYGLSRHDRWAMLGGQLVSSVEQRKPPFWVWNAALNQLYMSSYHLRAEWMPYYLDALAYYQVNCIVGYPSSIYSLAEFAVSRGRNDVNLKAVVTNAEPLFDYQIESIRAAFNCPVYETYGMAEIVAAASECESGSLHIWPEVGCIEVLADREENQLASDSKVASTISLSAQSNRQIDGSRTGDFVCTGLMNTDMPLIRYRVGDRGTLAPPSFRCPCGRTLPVIQDLDGRIDDVLYSADGRQIGRLDPVFKTDLPVIEAQVIQDSINKVRVRFVPSESYTADAGDSIVRRLRARMGNVEVILEPVRELPRSASGKFRAVICNLPEHERKVCHSP